MKKLLLLLTFSLFYFSIISAQKVKITGHVKFDDHVQKVYLSFHNGDKRISDSTGIKNGLFIFNEKVTGPTIASIMVRFEPKTGESRPRLDGMEFFLESGTINIEVKDSMKFAKVNGSKSQKYFEIISKMKEPFDKKGSTLSAEYMKYREDKDEEGMKKISDEFDALDSSINEDVYHRFLKKHPASPVSLYALGTMLATI